MELHQQAEGIATIRSNYEKFFAGAEAIWQLATGLLKEGEKIGIKNSPDLNRCLSGIFAKQLRLYYGINLLTKSGLDEEGQILLRSMFEIVLHLKFMESCSNKDEFSRLWLLWEKAREEQQLIITHGEDPKVEDLIKSLSQILEHDKRMMGKLWPDFLRYGPTNLSLGTLASHVDIQSGGTNFKGTYNTLFRMTSRISHGTDIGNYSKHLEENKMAIKLTPTIEYVDLTIFCSISMLRISMSIFNSLTGLGKDRNIAAMVDVENSLQPSVNV